MVLVVVFEESSWIVGLGVGRWLTLEVDEELVEFFCGWFFIRLLVELRRRRACNWAPNATPKIQKIRIKKPIKARTKLMTAIWWSIKPAAERPESSTVHVNRRIIGSNTNVRLVRIWRIVDDDDDDSTDPVDVDDEDDDDDDAICNICLQIKIKIVTAIHRQELDKDIKTARNGIEK